MQNILFEESEITIYNSVGQKVYFERFKAVNGEQNKEINLKHLPKGIYNLQLKLHDYTKVKQIIIN